MRPALHASCACLSVAIPLAASPAAAIELPNVGGEPMSLDVVNTAVVSYHFDNRNDDFRYAATYLDDNYGELLDRLDVQINWWRLQLGARIDASTYFNRPSATSVELQRRIHAEKLGFDTDDARRELHSRFLTTVYPAKLWLSYTQPGIEATVGDFYAQLGRGLVFSVRKLDELAIDTTVRGARIALNRDFQSIRVEATAFAGQMNPLRVDDASERRLHGDGSPLFFGLPGRGSVGDLVRYETTNDFERRTVIEKGRPNYLEDTVLGGRLNVGLGGVQLAANGALLLRKSYTREFNRCIARLAGDGGQAELQQDQEIRPGERIEGPCQSQFPEFTENTELTEAGTPQEHDTIRSFSGSLSVPSIAGHGDLYIEVAGQQLRDGHLDRKGAAQEDVSGYAVYVAANARRGPLAVSLEGKHYRRFFPLSANIDTEVLLNPGFNAPEFDGLSYNQPPTAEPIYVEPIGSPNLCITGGRGRVDYRFNRSAAVYAWLGYYASFSERPVPNNRCETDDSYRTDTWDTAAGAELDFDDGRSHVRAWVGARQSDEADSGHIFYGEGYVRYDVVKHVVGAVSLQLQGNSRRRYRPENFESSWMEGENYLALQWSPHLSAVLGHEYSSQPGCAPGRDDELCHFINGGLQWKSTPAQGVLGQIVDTAQLFVGQRRGGLRCVSGVCRKFPPFEGARLELVSKF